VTEAPRRAAYGAVAKGFHWLMFVMVGGMFPLGYVMSDMAITPQKLQLYSWHKSFGMVLLALAVLRLAWRLLRPPPPLAATASGLERLAAHTVHGLLYGCLFALPLSGWLMSSASGLPVVAFGLWRLPNLAGASEPERLLWLSVHMSLGFFLLALLAAHVAAALYHHLARRDDTLRRMFPFSRGEE
jgi:cytochrome b561